MRPKESAAFVRDEWIRTQNASVLQPAETLARPRSHSRTADAVLRRVCAIVSALALDPVADKDILFEQYHQKLKSQGNRLGVFCLSVTPAIAGMAVVYGAFKVLRKLQPRD